MKIFYRSSRSFAFALARAFLLLSCAYFVSMTAADGQSSPAPKATIVITYADGAVGKVSTIDGTFAPVDLLPGESVTLRTTVPQRFADTPAFVQPLDGGSITSELAVASDGTVSLGFKAGQQAGLYRLLFSARGRTALVQFQVQPQG